MVIPSRSLLLLLGSFRLAIAFCHLSARISPQFFFIPSMDYRNVSVFQDSARTLLSHVPFSWVAQKSRSMPRCTAPHCSVEISKSLGHAFSPAENRAAAAPAGQNPVSAHQVMQFL